MTTPAILQTRISRRGFMKSAGALTFAFTFGGALTGRPSEGLAQDGTLHEVIVREDYFFHGIASNSGRSGSRLGSRPSSALRFTHAGG